MIVSGVDESGTGANTAADLVAELARRKAEAVARAVQPLPGQTVVILGCDSMLGLDGRTYGKPGSPAVAAERWRLMRGRSGVLHTGHHLILHRDGQVQTRSAVASTTVHFAALSDAEIAGYVATREPLQVAGAFTVDGLGGPFVTRIEGDFHNVVGISLPLLRTLLIELGVEWPSLWSTP